MLLGATGVILRHSPAITGDRLPMAKRTAAVVANPTRDAIARKARRIRRRANPVRVSNDAGGGLGHQVLAVVKPIGVGAVGYGGTRLVQRLAWTLAVKRRPRWAKHVHAAAGILTFGVLAAAGRKVRAMEPYLEPVLIGSGIAAVQGVVTAYLPRFAWLTADPRRSELDAGDQPAQIEPGQQAQGQYDDYLEQQLQEYERPGRKLRPVQQTMQVVAAATGDTSIDQQIMEDLGHGEAVDDLYGGIFEDPTLSL